MKLSISILLFCFFACLVPQESSAQYITKKGKRYLHEGVLYERENMVDVFDYSTQSMLYYHDALSSYDRGQKLLFYGTAMLGTSAAMTVILVSSFSNSNNPNIGVVAILALGITVVGSVGIVLDVVSIPLYLKGKSKMKAAVNHFNWEVQQQLQKETSSINLGVTKNGFGLVYSF